MAAPMRMSADPKRPLVARTDGEGASTPGLTRGRQFALVVLLLVAVISLLLRDSFIPDRVLFSNDGPLGRLMSECHHLPEAFTGTWEDLNAVGYREQGAFPNISSGLRLVMKPLWFSNFYAPIALVILGLCAWCFFRQIGLAPPACVLGALAAAMNSCFFSTACWGVAGHVLALAMTFLALAALVKSRSWHGWLRAALAGMAVGMALAEGADMGALFSLCVAAFVLYQAWIAEGPKAGNLAAGAIRLGFVMVCAGFLAAYAISALIETQVSGVAGMEQDAETRESRWNWATQWSLPKAEAFSLIVPGLFGYRLDTVNGGCYWGGIGRDAQWTRYLARGRVGPKPPGLIRQTGSGIYAGITVVLVAAWAVSRLFRRRDFVFSPGQRRWLRFWLVLGVVALLLGFGYHAPFYRLVYALPFSSTVRNPVKFLALVNLAIVVLFAFGVDGLWRKYMARAASGPANALAAFKARWAAKGEERNWLAGCRLVLIGSLVAWGLYALSRPTLTRYLEGVVTQANSAEEVARFSVRQVGWFALFFLGAAGLVALIVSGYFSGARAKWGSVLLGLLLAIDLGRADQPWIRYWNYKQKYASNPVTDFLRQKPYEQRVVLTPFRGADGSKELAVVYLYEWAQHLFQYYDIQSSEIVQLSRTPEDMKALSEALYFDGSDEMIYRLFRRWEITNTRYILGAADSIQVMNGKFDPIQRRFRTVLRFDLFTRGEPSAPGQIDNMTAELAPDGRYAVFEFAGGLPRTKLYSQWEVRNDDQATLDRLASPSFDPGQALLVSGELPAEAKPATNAVPNAGTAAITAYSSRNVRITADAAAPAVLLLNDKFDPAWHVSVDGRPAPMLHCNYLMRGVYLEPGSHQVEFSFRPEAGLLRVSLSAIGIGGLLVVILAVAGLARPEPAFVSTPARAVVASAPAASSARKERCASKAKG